MPMRSQPPNPAIDILGPLASCGSKTNAPPEVGRSRYEKKSHARVASRRLLAFTLSRYMHRVGQRSRLRRRTPSLSGATVYVSSKPASDARASPPLMSGTMLNSSAVTLSRLTVYSSTSRVVSGGVKLYC